jgi:transitional endoplasmic reticulum ATPase
VSDFLQIEPTPKGRAESGVVSLDSSVMAEQGVEVGDVLKLTSSSGRTALARTGEPMDQDEDTSYIRLDNKLRASLKVGIGDQVEVEQTDLPEIDSVTVAPLSDVTGRDRAELSEYLRESFQQSGKVLTQDEIQYVTLPGAGEGSGFKILESDPKRGVVGPGTAVDIEFVFSTFGVSNQTTYDDIGGLEEELRLVREHVEFPLRFPDVYRETGVDPARGVILFGPPGNGKTLMIQAISNEVDASFHYINGPGIISSNYGESEQKLREIFEDARSSLPSIVFIDEMDAITPKREDTGTLADLRLVTQLMELMDGLETTEGVMIVGTTNRINSIEPALRRPGRFDREVYIGPPGEDARREILDIHTRGMLIDDDIPRYLDSLAERTQGYSGADLKELSREAGVSALRRQFGEDWEEADRSSVALSDIVVVREDFERAFETVRPSVLRGASTIAGDAMFNDIGGLDGVKQRLTELLVTPIEHPEVFTEMDVQRTPGILLAGDAGTGKSLLAEAVANESGATLLRIEGSEVFSEWVGKSESYLSQIFRIARRTTPAIVLIDNLESLAGTRSEGNTGSVSGRVTSQLLTELDRIREEGGVTVIGTTSRPDLIDDALLSPGRFAERVNVPLPSRNGRVEILRTLLRGTDTDLRDDDLDTVAGRTDGWTGAGLASLVRNAKLVALRGQDYAETAPVTGEDLLTALEETQTSG